MATRGGLVELNVMLDQYRHDRTYGQQHWLTQLYYEADFEGDGHFAGIAVQIVRPTKVLRIVQCGPNGTHLSSVGEPLDSLLAHRLGNMMYTDERLRDDVYKLVADAIRPEPKDNRAVVASWVR